MKFKKRLNKFKIISNFRTNIWGITKVYKQKKLKWKRAFLQTNLKLNPIFSKRFNIKYNVSKIFKQKSFFFKNNYKYKLQEKQKFKYFYGDLSLKLLKKINKKTKKINSYKKYINFIKILESKLDIVIYRSNLINNIFQIQKLIKNNKVLVNNKIITDINFMISPGDIIKFKLSFDEKKKFLNQFKKTYLFFSRYEKSLLYKRYYPKHLEFNYKTYTILYLNYPNEKDKLYYPFILKFPLSIRYLK